MAKYPPIKKSLRQGPGNNNAIAAGRTVRAPVPPLVHGGGFGGSGGGKHVKLSQTYDGQNMNHPKLNNARPVPKNTNGAAAEYTRDPAVSTAQRQLMAIAEHSPSKVHKQNRGVLKMSKGQLHDFASTKGLKS